MVVFSSCYANRRFLCPLSGKNTVHPKKGMGCYGGGISYYHDREAGLLQPDEKWTKTLLCLEEVSGRQVPFPAWGTLSAGRRRKVGKENCFHPISLYPCADKTSHQFHFCVAWGWPPNHMGLKNHIKNTKENPPAGLNHPHSPGVPSAHCLELDWQSWDHGMEWGPQDTHSSSHPLSYFFLRVDKPLSPGLGGSMQIFPRKAASSQDSCLKN